MSRIWRGLFLRVVIATCLGSKLTQASPCDGSPEILTVDYTPKRIFSPSYPDNYDNHLQCDWVFESIKNQRTGFGIQLTTLELQLDAPYTLKSGNCNDSLEAFEGTPSSLGNSLGKWCGKTKHIIKTMSTKVTLKFFTNEYYVGKGFVVEYSLVRVASAECQPGKVTPVHVGRAPLYESFDVKNVEERCTWTMESIDELGNSDPNSPLIIEAFSVPRVSCEVGYFIIYDGQDASSRKVLEWCDRGQAFSKIYMSSNYATLTFFFKLGKKQTSRVEPIQLKLCTRDNIYACNETHLPSINVGVDPVYFSVPFSKSPSGVACNMHVSQHIKNTVRIEVISVNGQEAACETDAVNVTTASKRTNVERLCNRQNYPMYLPHSHDLIVGVKNTTSTVYLRATSDDYYCGGAEVRGEAYDDLIREEMLPRENDFTSVPHNCYHRYVITTKHKNRTIALNIQWSPNVFQYNDVFTEGDACHGDFISVYDGVNESAPLLFSTCRKSDMPHNYVITRIIGTKEEMFILYNTDAANEAKRAVVAFYALPANSGECKTVHEISVNGTVQFITSPNYPEFYPLDYTCTYALTAAQDHVIVVEPQDTRFTSGCGDILNVYEGPSASPANIVGHICGRDRTDRQFVTRTRRAVIHFSSDKFGSSGGWKLRVYSRLGISGAYKADGRLIFILLTYFLGIIAFKI